MADAGRDKNKFMVRLPDGMRGRISEAAKANGRSMNAEIVQTLLDAYPDLEQGPEPTRESLLAQMLESLNLMEKSAEDMRLLAGHFAKVVTLPGDEASPAPPKRRKAR